MPPSLPTEAANAIRRIVGREQVVLLGRAAAGIWATLRVLGYAKRPILLPANSCYVVLWAVLHSGNDPVLVDVDPKTANVNVETITRAAVDDAAAIIPCHMYGLPAPMADVSAWAKTRGTFVIEDSALALGTEAGSRGDVTIFSFGLGKIVDQQVGGALATDDPALATEISRVIAELPRWDDRLLDLTNQWHNLYFALHQYEDRNPQLLTLYPALFDIYRPLIAYQLASPDWVGLPDALRDLDENLAHRSRMAALYDVHLHGLPVETFARSGGSSVWRYPLLVAPEHRDPLLTYLWENGIHDATRWYPSLRYMVSTLAPAVRQMPTPNTDRLGASIINLRVDQGVDEQYVERTSKLIAQFFENEM